MNTHHTYKAYNELLNITEHHHEVNIQSALKSLFDQYDERVSWILETASTAGRTDMSSHQVNVIIECKRRGSAHPEKKRYNSTLKTEETQEEQLARYVEEQHDLFTETHWRGFLTDGEIWFGYDWNPKRRNLRKLDSIWSYQAPQEETDFQSFCKKYIFSRYDPTKLRDPNLDGTYLLDTIFRPLLTDLFAAQHEMESTNSYKTKKNLWNMQLGGSGIVPPKDEESAFAKAFATHSFLVAISRILNCYLTRPNASDSEILDTVNDGFQSWIFESSTGYSVLIRLLEEIRMYNWRRTSRDVLKELYHALIPKEQRREFGEYYTPDYLAKAVVEQSLDDEWCSKQVEQAIDILDRGGDNQKGLGVLDPACGSGTFLFHCAHRFRRHINKKHRKYQHRSAEIVALLVNGIDIHPVAVEMSKATLAMALPESDKEIELSVALGDSMKSLDETSAISESLGVPFLTPEGQTFSVNASIANHIRSNAIVSRVIGSIVDGESLPLNEDIAREEILELRNSIEDVIATEGDHVWNWHIRNKLTMYKLVREKVGRIVGNPPWLVRNNTPDGIRKNQIDNLRNQLGVNTQTASYLPKGDLASVFTARVLELYLDSDEPNNQYAWILPGSALINEVWRNWRMGQWHRCHVSHESAWCLNGIVPPVFEQAPNGTCVVYGKKVALSDKFKSGNLDIERWKGEFSTARVTKARQHRSKKSTYLELVERGCFFGPFTYFVVEEIGRETAGASGKRLVEVVTQATSKGSWKGIRKRARIEKDVLIPLVSSKDLEWFRCKSSTKLIAPLQQLDVMLPTKDRTEKYPCLDRFWRGCNKEYKRLKNEGGSDILETNYHYPETLRKQLQKFGAAKTKVVYNASGTYLKAARISRSVVANQNCYWILCRSVAEARFLTGIINAPIMQEVWRSFKTSNMHFHKSPLRNVPVPLYGNLYQSVLASHAELAEQERLRPQRISSDVTEDRIRFAGFEPAS